MSIFKKSGKNNKEIGLFFPTTITNLHYFFIKNHENFLFHILRLIETKKINSNGKIIVYDKDPNVIFMYKKIQENPYLLWTEFEKIRSQPIKPIQLDSIEYASYILWTIHKKNLTEYEFRDAHYLIRNVCFQLYKEPLHEINNDNNDFFYVSPTSYKHINYYLSLCHQLHCKWIFHYKKLMIQS
jgi:hypothetical protein